MLESYRSLEPNAGRFRTSQERGLFPFRGSISEEFARDYGVPLEAVREALDYVANNLPLIEAERDREAADVRARGLDRPPWS
jgi:hypothetical protein